MKNLVKSLQTINKYCPTSGKVIYYTEREAATAAHYTTISTNIKMTYYRCVDCKHFHLTKASKPYEDDYYEDWLEYKAKHDL